ncbi:unnamed protein product [Cuscuta campestris]|uniref:RRM domain-containing protein n=1 Tax=Cuscuta campestris TaxID=132261 RepID=A0A484LTA6_9ASTE|nr:unnamed protein product [Cuscuta campestris]
MMKVKKPVQKIVKIRSHKRRPLRRVVLKTHASSEFSEEEEEEPSKTPKKAKDVKMVDATSMTQSEKRAPKTPATLNAPEQESKPIFIGNLSWSIQNAHVEDFFKDVGEIKEVCFASSDDGTFKGYGHVEFTTCEAATKALELNGQQWLGRDVRLDLA